jgi:hypothetical protein
MAPRYRDLRHEAQARHPSAREDGAFAATCHAHIIFEMGKSVQEGDRFRLTADAEVLVTVHWFAPLTSGAKAAMPEGTVVVARHDQAPGAEGFSCVPEAYQELEPVLVPEEDRLADKYGGYSVVFKAADIGTTLEALNR